jgi:hypothetical protein
LTAKLGVARVSKWDIDVRTRDEPKEYIYSVVRKATKLGQGWLYFCRPSTVRFPAKYTVTELLKQIEVEDDHRILVILLP